jgi:hypothetical protein
VTQLSPTNSQDENQQQNNDNEILRSDIRTAVLYSILITGVTLAGSFAVNASSGSEARVLLSAMLPTTSFLSSAVMTAAATTLALMLALVGFGQGTNSKLSALYYDRVEQIAFWNLVVFVGASSLLLFISIPLSESQEVPTNWYRILYYLVLFASGLLTGALTFVVILLFRAIKSLINLLHPNRDSDMVVVNESDQIELPRAKRPDPVEGIVE